MVKPGLLLGHVMHRRMRPVSHRFAYRIAALLLDIDRLAETVKPIWFLSYKHGGSPKGFAVKPIGGLEDIPLFHELIDEVISVSYTHLTLPTNREV